MVVEADWQLPKFDSHFQPSASETETTLSLLRINQYFSTIYLEVWRLEEEFYHTGDDQNQILRPSSLEEKNNSSNKLRTTPKTTE